MNPMEKRYGLKSNQDPLSLDHTVKHIIEHASCREFSAQQIPESLRGILYAAAQSAPSKSNLQQYSFLDVTDSRTKKKLCEWFPSLTWAFMAPMFTIALGDLHRNRMISAHHGYQYNAHPEDAFMNAAVDSALATQALIVAAESYGLGTCPISQIRERIEELATWLDLPDGCFPVCGLAIGYPLSTSKRISPRLPAEVVVHKDRYQSPNMERIHEYDARFNAAVGEPKPRYPERFGLPAISTWSENVARQTAVEERNQFRSFLKRRCILS